MEIYSLVVCHSHLTTCSYFSFSSSSIFCSHFFFIWLGITSSSYEPYNNNKTFCQNAADRARIWENMKKYPKSSTSSRSWNIERRKKREKKEVWKVRNTESCEWITSNRLVMPSNDDVNKTLARELPFSRRGFWFILSRSLFRWVS